MEFWGVEVKAGVPFEVKPNPGKLVHISHASLGDATTKEVKGAKSIPLRLKIDDKHMILGYLKPEERAHVSFDLVFEKQFVLSHDWKYGSIYFTGYVGPDPTPDTPTSDTENSSDEPEDELEKDSPAAAPAPAENDAPKSAKDAAAAAVEKSDDDEDSEDDSDEDMESSLGGDSSDDQESLGDDSEEEEEELPKENVQQSKKRLPAESAAPVSAKKAKAPAGRNATGKTPPGNKSKQSPKSGGGGGGGHSGKKGKRGGK